MLSLLRHDPAFSARYRYLLERPERRLAKPQALCALAAKLLRTLWCLAVHDQPYEVSRAWPGGVPLVASSSTATSARTPTGNPSGLGVTPRV